MGEVYRARDTKLNRDVALKVLPPAFAAHPERLRRFEREAQVLASLNHPNIAAIYGVEERALVMELVEGEALRGPLPLEQALTLARQLAEALEYAHDRGVVHRDLKPANIKVTPEGKVKVLDFGLAKAMQASPTNPLDDSETLSEAIDDGTKPGMILGTVGYMSPEQACGQAVDKRADIWAFGVILLELLTGQRAFRGATPTEVLASVIRDRPAIPEGLPRNVARLLGRCLEKDPRRRLRDIGEARIEIEDALAGGLNLDAPSLGERPKLAVLLSALLLFLGAVLLANWWWLARLKQTPPREVRFQGITDMVGMEESPAISPDGKTVAFVAHAGARNQLWLRLLAGGVPLQITHDDADHEQPRWAPDSSALIYFSPSAQPDEQGTIWEISALGGQPRRIASASSGGDISHDGRRIAAFQEQGGRTELVALARDGSGVEHLKQMPEAANCHHPRWSPDDHWIGFFDSRSDAFDDAIDVVPASGGESHGVVHGQSMRGMSWLPDGSGFVYASGAGSTILYPPVYNLRAVGRDGRDDRQLTFGDVSYVDPDMQTTGRLAASRIRIQSDIWRFPIGGSPAENTRAGIRITRQTAQAQTPSVSPEGREIVYLSDSGGHGNLWVTSTSTDGAGISQKTRQITFEQNPSVAIGVPVWSPAAGGPIVFILTRAGDTALWLVNSDGSGLRRLVTGFSAYWSADGRWVYYTARNNYHVEKISLAGGQPVLVQSANASVSGMSRDGSTIYLSSVVNSRWDCELQKAHPENGPLQTVSARIAGFRNPVHQAFHQFVLSPDDKWLASPLTDGGTSNIWALPTGGGPLRPVTDFGQRPILIVRRVSWSPDSKFIYAAVAETDADVVLLDGLLR
jgi:Tol biopolymer transport system component